MKCDLLYNSLVLGPPPTDNNTADVRVIQIIKNKIYITVNRTACE